MTPKMIDMGMKRKEMMTAETSPGTPKSDKAYENEKVYPEMYVDGAMAEMMGAEDMKTGDLVEQMVRWRVKSMTKTERDGNANYSMTLCLEEASDCKECESGDAGDGEDSGDAADAGDSADSPAMGFIQGKANAAD